MKKISSRRTLRQLIIEEIDLLLEQEEDLFGGEEEEATEEETPEDEPGEGGDEETEEEAEEEEEEEEPEGEEALPLGKSVDDDLNALFVDFETQALKVGEDEEAQLVRANEGKRKSLSYLLFEQEEEEVEEDTEETEEVEKEPEEAPEIPIDMETFASDVARLAMNYDSLLDMEELILVKAKDYIKVKHGEEKADELMDILDLRYQLSLEDEEPIVAPIAVGASAAAAGA
jgi:hypothetical protein